MTNNFVLLPYNASSLLRWLNITDTLKVLANKCVFLRFQGIQAAEVQYGHPRFWLQEAIFQYNKKAADDCNFRVVQEDDNLLWRLIKVLPVIIESALKLPQLVGCKPVPILKIGQNRRVNLCRNCICSLLAHGFLSTFPGRSDEDSKELANFNFWRLFHHENDSKSAVKREKIKCLLEYFEQMGFTGSNIPASNVTFERRYIKTPRDWKSCTEKLHILCVTTCGERIEGAKGMAQVDFANKTIGGGVLTDGAVQEEIRFIICPELIVSRLFTERLGDNEAVIITGSIQFSDYTGYGRDFKFKKLQIEMDDQGNILPRAEAQVIAIDAKPFYRNTMKDQYKKENIDRELHKSFVGFWRGSEKRTTPIATGMWGCGAFNGDPLLKFIIQWMTASYNQRSVQFYARNEYQKNNLEAMARHLVSRKVTIGQLYECLIRYESQVLAKILPGSRQTPNTVFKFLIDNIK